MSFSSYQIAYQKSPIVFVGGLASNMPGGVLPVTSVTQSQDFDAGVTEGSSAVRPEDYLFDFYVASGGQLGVWDIGRYPFANQQIAANAVITQPNNLSMMMTAPVKTRGGIDQKLGVFQALAAAVKRHIQMGGLFTVATPSYLYQNMILLALQDTSGGDPQRVQQVWRWDFTQPLLTLQAARDAQNALMQKVTGGAPLVADADGKVGWSGLGPAVGDPGSGQGSGVVPAAQNLPAAQGGTPSPTYGPGP